MAASLQAQIGVKATGRAWRGAWLPFGDVDAELATAQEMVEYCLRNPGVTRLLAPNGTWSCEGNKPRLPEGASWPVDARGFFPNAWIPVLPPQQPTG